MILSEIRFHSFYSALESKVPSYFRQQKENSIKQLSSFQHQLKHGKTNFLWPMTIIQGKGG